MSEILLKTVADFNLKLNEKELLIKEQNLLIHEKDLLLNRKDEMIKNLLDQLKLAHANRYARSSERYVDSKQLSFFDNETATENQESSQQSEEYIIEANPKNHRSDKSAKKKTGRKKIADYFPREIVICELPESELITEDGFEFVKIGEEVSEHLDVTPAQIKVIRIVRYKYACRQREEYGVKIAANISNQAIPKSLASNGLLAHMLVQKFCYHLPFYRQEQIWRNMEVEIPRSTMCNWLEKVSHLLNPLKEVLKEEIFKNNYINVDETPVTVLEYKKNKSELRKSSKSYMWVYANSINKLIMFDYQQSRSGRHAVEFLEGFKGYLQADAYSGYDQVYLSGEKIEVGCMAHARRKFTDITKLDKNHKHARHAILEIQKLYLIEQEIKENISSGKILAEEIIQIRERRSKPILDGLFKWILELYPRTPPKGSLGVGLYYCIKNKDALSRYLSNAILAIDNNIAENAIRPFALGRKNWLFCGNHKGAENAALIYSLIECAKAYKIKPYEYLKYLLDNMKQNMSKEQLTNMLPNLLYRGLI